MCVLVCIGVYWCVYVIGVADIYYYARYYTVLLLCAFRGLGKGSASFLSLHFICVFLHAASIRVFYPSSFISLLLFF